MNLPFPEEIEQIALESLVPDDPRPHDQPAGMAEEDDLLIGRTIGECRIVARIGTWSLGSILQAIRNEDDVSRVVIKTTRLGISDGLDLARATLRIQARLGDHPMLIPLSDAGVTDDAKLYFTSEPTDDQPIDVYCDHRQLSVVERVKLLISACEAVRYIHQHGVIHGELSPANIVITARGVPRLTDFGVARLVQERLGDRAEVVFHDPTDDRVEPRSIDCLSPEQVEGNAITTSTDVYALGVVLYGLLTGREPYQPETPASSDVRKAISEQTVQPPSQAVFRPDDEANDGTTATECLVSNPREQPTPGTLASARSSTPMRLSLMLAGDLDAIVAMALAKTPANRYSSTERFAEDLSRWIVGSPVRARSDSTVYRVTKLARKYVIPVVAALIIAPMLVIGLVLSTVGFLRARHDRDHALAASAEARGAMNHLMTHASEERLLDEPGFESLRETLFEDARGFYQKILDEPIGDPAQEFDQAVAYTRLAEIARRIGSAKEALAYYNKAVALWEGFIARVPNRRSDQEELASALGGMGQTLAALPERRDEAFAILHRSRQLDEALIDDDHRSRSAKKRLGQTLLSLAELESRTGRTEDATRTLQTLLDIEANLAQEAAADLDPPIMLASAHAATARIHAKEPDARDQATQALQEAIRLLTPISEVHPELANETGQLARILGELGEIQQSSGLLDAAGASFERAKGLLEGLRRAHPSVLVYQTNLADIYNRLCDVMRQRGETAEALEYARGAILLLEKQVADHGGDRDSRLALAKSHNNLGRLLNLRGDPTAALRSFQRSVDLYESLSHLEPVERYLLAVNVALCIPLIDAPKPMETKASGRDSIVMTRRRLYGNRAMAALKQARHSGFLNADRLQNDADLNSLRERDDFQALIKEIEESPWKPLP